MQWGGTGRAGSGGRHESGVQDRDRHGRRALPHQYLPHNPALFLYISLPHLSAASLLKMSSPLSHQMAPICL